VHLLLRLPCLFVTVVNLGFSARKSLRLLSSCDSICFLFCVFCSTLQQSSTMSSAHCVHGRSANPKTNDLTFRLLFILHLYLNSCSFLGITSWSRFFVSTFVSSTVRYLLRPYYVHNILKIKFPILSFKILCLCFINANNNTCLKACLSFDFAV